jgi:hypothetical protein
MVVTAVITGILLVGLRSWLECPRPLKIVQLLLSDGSLSLLIARNTHRFCVHKSVLVRALGGKFGPPIGMIAMVAHSFSVLLLFSMWTPCNELLVLTCACGAQKQGHISSLIELREVRVWGKLGCKRTLNLQDFFKFIEFGNCWSFITLLVQHSDSLIILLMDLSRWLIFFLLR